ncbi:MAG: cytochrome c [Planctomycetaceae bacterium]|nr:cytochrome c [Planctomycetaceae bacterium]
MTGNEKTAGLLMCACMLMSSLTLTGCERSEPARWTPSELVTELPDPALQDELNKLVTENSGTASTPQLVTQPNPTFKQQLHLKHGQAVYRKRCVQCHGENGDGNGEAADHLYPRPRDYTRGIFKFTSTPYGARPRREDLIRVVHTGVTGTSMPRFNRLPEKDIKAVVDYVMVLSQRGELQFQLAMEADAAEELDPEYVPEFIEDVVNRWQQAGSSLTQPLTPQPELTAQRAALGREAFLSKGCSKCHGDDGRGHTKDNIGSDSWGYPTRAADLTSGMLRGGQQPIDVYRRIMNGINGTPMPGFKAAFASEPDTIWNLVAFVLQTSNRRRYQEEIPAGLMKPYDTLANTARAQKANAGSEGGAAPEG